MLPSASPLPYPEHAPNLRLPAIPEGWPHHSWEANHLMGFPRSGLPTLWRGYTPAEQLPSTACPLEELHSPEMSQKALPGHRKSASIVGQSCQFWLPWGSACLPVAQLSTPALGRCCTLAEQSPAPLLPSPPRPRPRKSSAAQKHQSKLCPGMGSLPPSQGRPASPCLPWGSPPFLQSDPASPAHPRKMPCCLKKYQPTLPALRKHFTGSAGANPALRWGVHLN